METFGINLILFTLGMAVVLARTSCSACGMRLLRDGHMTANRSVHFGQFFSSSRLNITTSWNFYVPVIFHLILYLSYKEHRFLILLIPS